jgi:hypothetical protein
LRRFELLEEGEDSVVAIKNKLRRLSTVGSQVGRRSLESLILE